MSEIEFEIHQIINKKDNVNISALYDIYELHKDIFIRFIKHKFDDYILYKTICKNFYLITLDEKFEKLKYLWLFNLFNNQFINIIEENTILKIYKNINDEIILRVFDKYDILISINNIYPFISSNGTLFCRFYEIKDKDTTLTNLLQEFNYTDNSYLEVDDPLLKIILYPRFNIFKTQIWNEQKRINESQKSDIIIHTPQNVKLWKQFMKEYINEISEDDNFTRTITSYTSNSLMFLILRTYFDENIYKVSKLKVLNDINILNYGIYNSCNFISKKYNSFYDNIVLYRGITNARELPLTKNSIINFYKNQFISFTSNYDVAQLFGRIIFKLIIENNDCILPIEDIVDKRNNIISSHAKEFEWLLPLNTSFIVSDDIIPLNYNIIIPIKIYKQEYIENINASTFSEDMLKNHYNNFENFVMSII